MYGNRRLTMDFICIRYGSTLVECLNEFCQQIVCFFFSSQRNFFFLLYFDENKKKDFVYSLTD